MLNAMFVTKMVTYQANALKMKEDYTLMVEVVLFVNK